MSNRKDWFEELMQDPPRNREIQLTTFFLQDATEAVNAMFKGTALRTAADFDSFRRQAREHHGNPFYEAFFDALSNVIKRYHLDEWRHCEDER